MATYRTMIVEALAEYGETWWDIRRINVGGEYADQSGRRWASPDEALDTEVDTGYGAVNGPSFTAWTGNRVYFGACYDGSEWIVSAPRNPCNEIVRHVGGG